MPRFKCPRALPVWKPAALDFNPTPRKVSKQRNHQIAKAQAAHKKLSEIRARERVAKTQQKAAEKVAQKAVNAQTRSIRKAAQKASKAANAQKLAQEKAERKAAEREAKIQAYAQQTAEQKAAKREASIHAKLALRDARAKARYPSRQAPFAGRPGVKRTVLNGQLVCLDCGPRPVNEFRVITRKQTGKTYYESRCTRCRQTRCAARNQNLPPEIYRSMMEAAGGKCAICGKTAKLVLDHCHETGRVRGMLCGPCNQALAPLEKDPDVVQRMAEYLRYWRDAPMTEAERTEGIERERRRLKLRESSDRSKAKSRRRIIQIATA